jgi:predicted Zn-dependent protease
VNRAGVALWKVIVVLMFGGCAAVIAPRVYPFNHCDEPGAAPCPSADLENGFGRTIPRAEACRDSGYLCTPGGSVGGSGVLRWSLSRGRLRIRVPSPDYLPADLAREYRAVAIEGILGWNGHPFRLDIDTAAFPTRLWDVELFWTGDLSRQAGAEGVAHLGMKQEGTETPELTVRAIAVLTTIPYLAPGSRRAVAEVRTIAAHEMGHALGLGHSDQKTDVMSGRNSGNHVRVSARDLATVDALYRLPRGASIK